MICEIAGFISSCPELGGKVININYLDSKIGSCCVESVAKEPEVQQYTDGGQLYTERFILAIREDYSAVRSVNEKEAEKCRKIEKWFEKQNRIGNLPVLGRGLIAADCQLVRGFVLALAGSMDARYEAVIQLKYYHEP